MSKISSPMKTSYLSLKPTKIRYSPTLIVSSKTKKCLASDHPLNRFKMDQSNLNLMKKSVNLTDTTNKI